MGHLPLNIAMKKSAALGMPLLAALALSGCNLAGALSPSAGSSSGPSLFGAVSSATSATGDNGRGQVVGDFSTGAAGEAFHWTNGIATRLVIPGALAAYARGINDHGAIVGGYVDAAGAEHGFLLAGGKLQTIDVPGASVTAAFGINEAGAIVGNFIDGDGVRHGFLLQAGSFVTIDGPGALWTQAFGINASGQVVGFYLGSDYRGHGFLLSEGSYTTIDAPAAAANTATYGINSKGQIVGFYDTQSGGRLGFFLERGVWMTIRLPRAAETSPIGINDAGQIAGEYVDARGRLHGFLTARPSPLNDLRPVAAGLREDSNESSQDVSSAMSPAAIRQAPRDLETAAASLGIGAVRGLERGARIGGRLVPTLVR
jgi:uncharacterized membrane protein